MFQFGLYFLALTGKLMRPRLWWPFSFSFALWPFAMVLGCTSIIDAPVAGAPLGHSSVLTPRDIATIRDIDNLVLSPARDRLAFLVNEPNPDQNDSRLTWIVIPTDGSGDAVLLADGGTPVASRDYGGNPGQLMWNFEAKWSPDGEWLAYVKGVEGVRQLWAVPLRGGRQFVVNNPDRNILAFAWSEDGKSLLYQEGKSITVMNQLRQKERDRGYLFDSAYNLAVRETVSPAERPGAMTDEHFARRHGEEYDVSRQSLPDGRVELASAAEMRHYFEALGVFEKPFDSQAAKIETAFAVFDSSTLKFSRDGTAAVWREQLDTDLAYGQSRLVAWSQTLSSDPIVCEKAAACIGYWPFGLDAYITPDQERIVFLRSQEMIWKTPEAYIWNISDNTVRGLPNHVGSLRKCVIDDEQLYCVRTAALVPPQLAAISLEKGTTRVLYDPNAQFGLFQLPTVEEFEWEIEDGKRGFGRIIYPLTYEHGKKYPLIISCYTTGGFLRGGQGQHTPLLAMASRGYVVLECALPHHVDLEFINTANAAEEFFAELGLNIDRYKWWARGIRAGVDELHRRGLIDLDAVAMAGHSNGSYATAQAIIDGDWIAAAVMLTPTSAEEVVFWINTPYNQDALTAVGAGAGTRAWDFQSLAIHVDQVDVPILFQASESEMVSAIYDYSHLRHAGVPSELYIYADEFHSKGQPSHKLAVYERSADWIDFWLLGVEDSDPTKAEQYQRWRNMRDERCAGTHFEKPSYCSAH